jgi:hypothetical protein
MRLASSDISAQRSNAPAIVKRRKLKSKANFESKIINNLFSSAHILALSTWVALGQPAPPYHCRVHNTLHQHAKLAAEFLRLFPGAYTRPLSGST